MISIKIFKRHSFKWLARILTMDYKTFRNNFYRNLFFKAMEKVCENLWIRKDIMTWTDPLSILKEDKCIKIGIRQCFYLS